MIKWLNKVESFYIKHGFSAKGLLIAFGIMLQVRILGGESGVQCSLIYQDMENIPHSLSRDVSLGVNSLGNRLWETLLG